MLASGQPARLHSMRRTSVTRIRGLDRRNACSRTRESRVTEMIALRAAAVASRSIARAKRRGDRTQPDESAIDGRVVFRRQLWQEIVADAASSASQQSVGLVFPERLSDRRSRTLGFYGVTCRARAARASLLALRPAFAARGSLRARAGRSRGGCGGGSSRPGRRACARRRRRRHRAGGRPASASRNGRVGRRIRSGLREPAATGPGRPAGRASVPARQRTPRRHGPALRALHGRDGRPRA